MKILMDALFHPGSRSVPAKREHCLNQIQVGFDPDKTQLITTISGAKVMLCMDSLGDESVFVANVAKVFAENDFNQLPELKHFEPATANYGGEGIRELDDEYFSGIVLDHGSRYVIHARLSGYPGRLAS